jgi:ribosome-associated heat shock protein Hsp15
VPIELDNIRLDKWLWTARFYKTRSLATEAINGGKVHVNGQRTKPAKELKAGDKIEIHKSGYSWELTVTALTTQRRSAKDAALLYEESQETRTKRQEQIQAEKEQKALLGFSGIDRKPNKKERRLIHRFKRD